MDRDYKELDALGIRWATRRLNQVLNDTRLAKEAIRLPAPPKEQDEHTHRCAGAAASSRLMSLQISTAARRLVVGDTMQRNGPNECLPKSTGSSRSEHLSRHRSVQTGRRRFQSVSALVDCIVQPTRDSRSPRGHVDLPDFVRSTTMVTDSMSLPDDQQEDEGDIDGGLSNSSAVVLNADWTIETLNLQITKGNIDLNPSFQRRTAWSNDRKSRLIESIIVGMPVPNIVLAESQLHRGRFIVIDGKQRLVSISEFFSGAFKLQGMHIRKDLDGVAFEALPASDRASLENATLRASVIRNWGDKNFLYLVFHRLNSGSLPLSPQELRKALFGGKLLEAIERYLADSTASRAFFGDALDRRMRDSELVLRFLAFDRSLPDYKGNFKKFLDETTQDFEANWSVLEVEAKACFERLDRALETAHAVFGDKAFKKWLGDKHERVINRAIFDSVARFFAEDDVAAAARAKKDEVQRLFNDLCLDKEFRSAIEQTTKTVQATHHRIGEWGKSLASCLGRTYNTESLRID
jgi:hypothetical protein